MLGKVDKGSSIDEAGESQVLVSPDGGTTWVAAKCDDEGRLIIEVADSGSTISTNLEGIGDVTVGLTQTEVEISGTPKSIRIRADKSNTGVVFLGNTGIKSDGSNDFVRFESGDEIIMPYNDSINALYAISDTAAQKINVGILL